MNNEKYSAARRELLVKYLREFIGEKSWFDFKSNDVAPDKFGAYLAGLPNAACLANQPFGCLVFGVDDVTHDVVGMSDTVGLGIRTIFGIQKENGLPVPTYELEKEPRSVTVTIPGLPEGSNWVLPERRKRLVGQMRQ